MMATTSSLIHTAKATGGEHDGHGKVADPHVWPSCGGDEIEEKKRFKNTFAVAQAIILKEAQVFFHFRASRAKMASIGFYVSGNLRPNPAVCLAVWNSNK
jgi:hypothetical protein